MDLCKTNFLRIPFLEAHGASLFVITDTNVNRLYREKCLNTATWLVIPSGEQNKTRNTKERLEDELLSLSIHKNDLIVALGGGVVTDIVGFVSGTLLRGIPYINIPTTFLGMVDASIGGKTGVNSTFGKSTIGMFYPPVLVHTEIDFLDTLPIQEMWHGFAEVIKYALTIDTQLFQYIRQVQGNWREQDKNWMQMIIDRSQKIKYEIVEQDPYEKGKRKILNFGHTIAHALELLMQYTITHGEAVAVGLLIEAYISYLMGVCPYSDVESIVQLFKHLQYPITSIAVFSEESWIAALVRDKKNCKNAIYFVLIRGIGDVVSEGDQYAFPVDKKYIFQAVTWFHRLF